MKGKVGLEKWRWRYTAGKRGREERGRLDSIKPKPAGKQFGILHFFSEFFGDFFLLFYSFYRLSTWFKDGGLILYRVDDCFSVFRLCEGECSELNADLKAVPVLCCEIHKKKTFFFFLLQPVLRSIKRSILITFPANLRGLSAFRDTFFWTYRFTDRLGECATRGRVVCCTSSAYIISPSLPICKAAFTVIFNRWTGTFV